MSERAPRSPKKVSRRDLLAALVPAAIREAAEDAVPGRFRLDTLGEMPDEILLPVVPAVRDDWTVDVEEDSVLCRNGAGGVLIVRMNENSCAAVRLFDGETSLMQAARILEDGLGLDPGAATPWVREAFLRLAESEVFQPARPPETE